MSTFFEIAYKIILPIFLVVGVSALVDRRFSPDPAALSRLVIYLFTPALALEGLAKTDLNAGEAVQLIGLSFALSALVALAAWWVARLVRLDQRTESAFVLTAVLINAGNYGIPLNEFAFGTIGEERALVFFIGTVFVSNTLGVFLASRGAASTRQALLNVLKVPLPYAALAGLLVNVSGADMPLPVDRAVHLLAQAAIPGMLAILGIQLSRATIKNHVPIVLMASGMRLLVSPLIALGLALLFGLSGLTKDVAIVQAAMPTAVLSGVLAAEFGSDTEFVTATVLVSTLLSTITLTLLLTLIM